MRSAKSQAHSFTSSGARVTLAVALLWLVIGECMASGGTLAEWTFNRPGEFQGWQPNGHLAEVAVTNGSLSCRAAGADPILELTPLLEIAAAPLQVVEIRLKADRDGTAELFWSNTSTGRYGGFAQEKTTRFNVRGDQRWHVYRMLPFWHAEGKIVRLRLDLYDGASFELAQIRIVDLGSTAAVAAGDFDLTQNPWRHFEPVLEPGSAESAVPVFGDRSGTGLFLSPPLRIDATSNSFVSLRMSVDRGSQGQLFYATDKRSGLHSRSFRLQPDGREHTYNLDLLDAPDWSGNIVALGLQPSDDANATTILHGLKLTDQPDGPAQLQVLSFALEEALPRSGRPATLAAIISNSGGDTATNVVAVLELPSELRRQGTSAAELKIERLNFDQHKRLQWKVESKVPLAAEVRLTVNAANAEKVVASAPVRFSPRLKIPSTSYVPEPKPVRGPFEVGVYYFPGWKTASQWQVLANFTERRPVLGWYREGEPEVADWHIKWAVEHGVTFFAYDWYWSKGARQLEHALHDGYFKARYRHLLKFCLLWANHNPPKSSSHEDCLNVTRFWVEHYFRRPEHLNFEAKPVVIIFAPDRLTEDLGSAGVKRALMAMREECQRAGLKGLHLVACIGDTGGARRAVDEGYDSVTAYNWPGLGLTGESKRGPFSTLVESYRRHWEHLLDSGSPLAPLPVCGGWDSRPWHGDNNLVRYGRTPELFKRHLLDARRLLESPDYKPQGAKAILIEAWNEWGEGSYVEPHAEFGFGYLDAIRETFTDAPVAHEDITPADANLGPYDVPPPPASRIDWDFADSAQGWDDTMDIAELKARDGVLVAHTTGQDPAFFGPGFQVQAAEFNAVVVRMKLSARSGQAIDDMAQLFWRTSRQAESESTSARFPVRIDGEWHEYAVPVAANLRWRGTVTRLRLDPVTQPAINVEIDRLWLK